MGELSLLLGEAGVNGCECCRKCIFVEVRLGVNVAASVLCRGVWSFRVESQFPFPPAPV